MNNRKTSDPFLQLIKSPNQLIKSEPKNKSLSSVKNQPILFVIINWKDFFFHFLQFSSNLPCGFLFSSQDKLKSLIMQDFCG